MGILRILSELAEVGITRGQLDKALAESVEAREAVIKKAREVQRYWQDISPVSDKNEHGVYGVTVGPRSYKKSIKTKWSREKDGSPATASKKIPP